MANSLIWIPKRLVEVGLINVAARQPEQLVAYCEAEYENRIALAATLAEQSGARIVMLTGPSASGKTTTAHKLAAALRARGHCSEVVSLDNFYKNISEYPRLENGDIDYESVDALDLALINRCLLELVQTGETHIPDFDFKAEERRVGSIPVSLGKNGIAIVEGIHALNPRLTALLPAHSVFKIYAGLREEYCLSGQRILPTREVRLARRLLRDSKERGHDAQKTIAMWDAVCQGEDKCIRVYKTEADLLLDTSFAYEILALAPFVREIAAQQTQDNACAWRIAALARCFAPCAELAETWIPKQSMLREFLG